MATFTREAADIAALYMKKKTGPAEDQYDLVRLPYNLITYDDGTSGIEAVAQENLETNKEIEESDRTFNRIQVVSKHPFGGVNFIDN